MGQKPLARSVDMLDFGMGIKVAGLQQAGEEDELNDLLITTMDASVTAPSLRRNEDRLSTRIPVLILREQRSLNTPIPGKVTKLLSPCPNATRVQLEG